MSKYSNLRLLGYPRWSQLYVSLVCFFNPSKTLGCSHFSIFQEPENTEALYPISFLCPNGTIFNQEVFVCEWWSVFLFNSDFLYLFSKWWSVFFYIHSDIFTSIQIFYFTQLVLILCQWPPLADCIKYNRSSKSATKRVQTHQSYSVGGGVWLNQ